MHPVTCLLGYSPLEMLQNFRGLYKSQSYIYLQDLIQGEKAHSSCSKYVLQRNKVGETLPGVITRLILSKTSTGMISLTDLLFGISLLPFTPISNWTSVLIEIHHFYVSFLFSTEFRHVHVNVPNTGVFMSKTGSISNCWWYLRALEQQTVFSLLRMSEQCIIYQRRRLDPCKRLLWATLLRLCVTCVTL